jgi:hypothetical protein
VVEVQNIDTPYGPETICKVCGGEVEWEDCPDCEEGYSYHDCGEDCCCCIDPQPNVKCHTCDGEGGWWRCFNCESKTSEVKVADGTPTTNDGIPPKDKSLGILPTIL